jgi:hypothetical protein
MNKEQIFNEFGENSEPTKNKKVKIDVYNHAYTCVDNGWSEISVNGDFLSHQSYDTGDWINFRYSEFPDFDLVIEILQEMGYTVDIEEHDVA